MNYLLVFIALIGCLYALKLSIKWFRRKKTVPELWAQVDPDFAVRFCCLNATECECFNESEWKRICTLRGLMHMLRQVCLLTKIIIEVKNESPDLYPTGTDLALVSEREIRLDAIRCVVERLLKPFMPRITWVHGRAVSREFANIFGCAEQMYAEFDYSHHLS